MQLPRLYRIGIAVLCLILIVNLVLFIITRSEPRWIRDKASEGRPFLFADRRTYWSAITDCAASGEYLYILLRSKGILACYDLDGNYSHSYALSMSQNGQAHLYVDGNKLYLESSEHYFYCFEDGIFTDFNKPALSELTTIRASLNTSTAAYIEETGVQYKKQGASVLRIDENESKEILHRSRWLVIFDGPTQLVIHIVCIILLFLMKHILR